MGRILLIANTYYQLIFAIQMKSTIFKEEEVVLLLSDHSKNAESVFKKIKGYNLFYQVEYIKTKGVVKNRNVIDRLADCFNIILDKDNRYKYYIENLSNWVFDEMICYNYNIDVIGLYYILSKHNRKLKVSLFEEGILSYDIYFKDNIHRRIIKLLRTALGKIEISSAFYSFYCFYPKLYSGSLRTTEVPRIVSNSPCVNLLCDIFGLNTLEMNYSFKYIYFSSVYDFEGGNPVGELELVKKIREVVGNDNLLIKIHPRDTRDIYIRNGFNVDRNSSVPWEVIQLSGDFSNKVFLTVNSGSVLAGSFMSVNAVRTFYMYRLCDISGNTVCQKSVHDIESLLNNRDMKEILSKVSIADKIEDIVNE